MIYLVYFLVFLILCFILYLAIQALGRGLEAKNKKFSDKTDSLKNKKNTK
jgi:hypothetical protein